MRHFLLISLFCCASLALSAQGILQRQADQAMQDLDYMTAIVLYQQVLENDDNSAAKISLAECYRKINDTENAERWYAEVVKTSAAKSIHRLYYGMMLQANGKCAEAKTWFDIYRAERPDDARGRHLAAGCDQVEQLNKAGVGIYVVSRLPFNSNMDDYSPTLQSNQIIFASDRHDNSPLQRTNMWTGASFTELYRVPFQPNAGAPSTFQYGPAAKFSPKLNSKFHEAAVTFSADGKTIFFTRNNFVDGKTGRDDEGLVKLKIYTGNASQPDQWENLQALPFCSDEYSVAHPSVTADGKRLYFSSNKPGGYGGMDLYFSDLEAGRWGLPMNLGPDVNTEGNEIFPFISADRRLYFASNGHVGLGGLDIYYTTPKGKGDWNTPVNPGAPLNSSHDDFGVTFNPEGTWGFFSSDREGGLGRDDIYSFTKRAVPMEIYVTDPYTKTPVAGVAVTNQTTGLTLTTSAEGKIGFDMRPDECVTFSLSKKNYEIITREACTNNVAAGQPMRLNLALEKKANHTLQGLVFDMMDGLPAEGVLVTLTNDCGKPVDVQTTSEEGRYQFRLDKNCCYTVKATAEGYIADVSDRQCTVGLAPGQGLRADLSLEPYRDADGFVVKKATPADALTPHFNPANGLYENADGTAATYDFGNGLTLRKGVLFDNGTPSQPSEGEWQRSAAGFLVHLYYDFNATAIPAESEAEMQKLLTTLLENPELKVEIASHTDARGTAEYNLDLSQRRADAVVDWLANHAIARDRLTAHGYGETQPINDCSDDKPCTEEQHQLNRRTEFRVIGKNSVNTSKPDEKPKVAPCVGCPF